MKKNFFIAAILVFSIVFYIFFSKKKIEINILLATDERIQALSEQELEILKKYIAEISSNLLDIKIIIKNTDRKKFIDYIKNVEAEASDPYRNTGGIYDKYNMSTEFYLPKVYDHNELSRIIEPVFATLNMDEKKRFFSDAFAGKFGGLYHELPESFYSEFSSTAIENVRKLLSIKDKYGKDFFSLYYNFRLWDNMIKSEEKFELILFNGMLLDDLYKIQTSFMSLHTFQRGGLSYGFASKSKTEQKRTCVIGMMPIMSDEKIFEELRGKLTGNDKLLVLAHVICHEFGHAFLDYYDEYSHENCIMNPVDNYNFIEFISKKKYCDKKHRKLGLDE